jgi:hypothetical protein
MAVTPNYSWPVPVATDLVKDGYQAIADLGDAIDATVYGQSSALVLVKSQVIGSAVASVAVTGAFSTTYDAYKIVIANTVPSASTVINMILGSTATGYYYTTVASTFSTGAYTAQLGAANTTLFTAVGNSNTANVSNSFELISPFLSAKTFFNANYVNVGGAAAGNDGRIFRQYNVIHCFHIIDSNWNFNRRNNLRLRIYKVGKNGNHNSKTKYTNR